MKIPSRSLLGLSLLGTVFISACTSSSSMSRIDAKRTEYESWPVEVQEAVLNRRVVKGMTPEMVTTALGRPSSVEYRSRANGENLEVWMYKGGGLKKILPLDVGLGTGIGPVGVYASKPIGTNSSADYDEVIFSEGLVVSSESIR